MENNQQQQNPALKLEKSSTAKSNSNLSAGQKEKVTGLITEALPDTTFKVRLEDGKEVLVYLAGKMRINYIKVMVGDKVSVELSPDGTRGRIVRRL